MNISELKNKFNGETIALIGNGGSLTMSDLELIKSKGVMTYGVNKIFLAYDQTEWRPDFYSASDHAIIKDVVESFKIYRPEHLIMPFSTQEYFKGFTSILDDICFVNHLSRSDEGYVRDFSRDVSKVSYGGYTVLFFALQVIYFLGFQKVIIMGLDHDYSKAKVVPVSQRSHNGRMLIHKEGSNHFHPDYFKKDSLIGDVYITESEESFEMADRVFSEAGRSILNCSRSTKLTVLKRSSLEDEI